MLLLYCWGMTLLLSIKLTLFNKYDKNYNDLTVELHIQEQKNTLFISFLLLIIYLPFILYDLFSLYIYSDKYVSDLSSQYLMLNLKINQQKRRLTILIIILFLTVLSSATLYSISADYKIAYQKSYSQLAHAIYRERGFQTGWNYLHIYASESASLLDQHRGAGFLEGYATYKQIYYAYRNYIDGIIKSPRVTLQIEIFLSKQLQFLDELSKNHQNDLYRSYVNAKMQQLRYMYRGYLERINEQNEASYYISFSQFYYLTMVGDIRTLNKELYASKDCTAYVKFVNNSLMISHSSENPYELMIRIMKSYYFPSRDPRVGSQFMVFSSRPGDLNSKDDFYIMSNGMRIMETSLGNYNQDNYKILSPRTVPCWLRAIIANNLGRNVTEWTDYFLKFNSGTHNSQWIVIDSKQLQKAKDIVWFVEQAFDLFVVTDFTHKLLSDGYLASYNMPYDKKIYQKISWQKDQYNFQTEPRARILKKYDKLMIDQESMKKWLLTNEQQNPKEGLASRQDMATDQPDAFGMIDTKIFSQNTQLENYIWVISGPSTSNGRFPIFDWNKWESRSHKGMPSQWNFTWDKAYLDYQKEEFKIQ